MAEYTSFVMDPFYALSREVEATKTKVADSVFENYKLQVAQTNDINNRDDAIQVNSLLTEADAVMCNRIENDVVKLIQLADEMAESATSFEGQGYKCFLESREKFVTTLNVMSKHYKEIFCLLKH